MEKNEKEMLKQLSEGGKHYLATSGYRRGYGAVASDKTPLAEKLLKEADIKFSVGNDAPRGGLNGKFIKNAKFSFEKAVKNIELKRLEMKSFFEGRTYAEQLYKKQMQQICQAVFGVADLEISKSGNIYGKFQKPLPIQIEQGTVPQGLRRIAANGELQVFMDGKWIKF